MTAFTFARPEVKDLVSVVIPTYRAERFIGETLDSVGHQDYSQWEVIVVEDGPQGPTRQIVADFARQHASRRIHYISNEQNYGPSHSRNIAFEHAHGEFVALLDSDDHWFPDHLTCSLQQLQASGKDIAYSSVVMFEDETDLLLDLCGPRADDLADFPLGLFRRNFITPSAVVLRRQVLADVGPWDTRYRLCEDLDYWLRCVARDKQFQYVGGCHCLYRKNHTGSATRNLCALYEAFAEVIERYIQLPGLREDKCRTHVSKAYRRAAELHATIDPLCDPTADPARSAQLLVRAWRLRPQRVNYLLKGAVLRIADLILHRTRPKQTSVEKPPIRAAA